MKKIILALAALGTTFSFIACGDDSSSASPSSVESSSSESYESLDKSSSSTKDTKLTEESSSSVVESSSSTPIEDPDSKSDNLLSCDRTFKTTVEGVTTIKHMCGETSYSPEKEKLMECSSEGPLTAIKGTGCPSGEKKICEDKEQGVIFYVYDEESADKSCEELMGEKIEIEYPDSKSDDLLSCDRTFKTTVEGVTTIKHMCGETSYSPEKEKLMECSSKGPLTAIKGTGCPSGEKKTCKVVKAGFEVVFYVYDEESSDKSCEELMDEKIEVDSDVASEGGDE